MKIKRFIIFLSLILFNSFFSCQKAKEQAISIHRDQDVWRVKAGGQSFTALVFKSQYHKPVLYPVFDALGNEITRGWPVNPREGERVDHPHHIGVWMNHGDVNNIDFWNNSEAIPANKKHEYGSIIPDSVWSKENKLVFNAHWLANDTVFIEEHTIYEFFAYDSARVINRTTTWNAQKNITIEDSKEGMFAIRVSRALEQPYLDENQEILKKGKVVKASFDDKMDAGGLYLNKEGLTGDAVWGERSPWVVLFSLNDNYGTHVMIADHPENFNYPAHWMARGYGLFAVNPLGTSVYDKNSDPKPLILKKGEEVTFKYSLIISNRLNPDYEEMYNEFIE